MKKLALLLCVSAFGGVSAACSGGTSTPTPVDPPVDPDPPVSAAVLALEHDAYVQVNVERALDGKQPLVHDDLLREVARAHSEDMADRDFFAHTNPDGDSPFDRMQFAGHTYSTAGENIAWNQGYSDPATQAVVGWMNSTGHRNNILNGQFTHTGMGVAIGANNAHFFTQVFSRPTGQLVLSAWVTGFDFDEDIDEPGGDAGWSSMVIRK